MGDRIWRPDKRFYVHQADVALNQADPVSGTQYALLPLTTYVHIYMICMAVSWTVQPNPIEIHPTFDGILRLGLHTLALTATTYYYTMLGYQATTTLVTSATIQSQAPNHIASKECEIFLETTGGTTSSLSGRCKYARYI